jgi:hypothetical protein
MEEGALSRGSDSPDVTGYTAQRCQPLILNPSVPVVRISLN